MASARAGVMTSIEVNSPMPSTSRPNYADQTAPSFWCVVWFVVAVFLLFVVL